MLYMAQIGVQPPRFSIQVNSRSGVTRDYAYFVENRLRDATGSTAIPLIIDFAERKRAARRRGSAAPARRPPRALIAAAAVLLVPRVGALIATPAAPSRRDRHRPRSSSRPTRCVYVHAVDRRRRARRHARRSRSSPALPAVRSALRAARRRRSRPRPPGCRRHATSGRGSATMPRSRCSGRRPADARRRRARPAGRRAAARAGSAPTGRGSYDGVALRRLAPGSRPRSPATILSPGPTRPSAARSTAPPATARPRWPTGACSGAPPGRAGAATRSTSSRPRRPAPPARRSHGGLPASPGACSTSPTLEAAPPGSPPRRAACASRPACCALRAARAPPAFTPTLAERVPRDAAGSSRCPASTPPRRDRRGLGGAAHAGGDPRPRCRTPPASSSTT